MPLASVPYLLEISSAGGFRKQTKGRKKRAVGGLCLSGGVGGQETFRPREWAVVISSNANVTHNYLHLQRLLRRPATYCMLRFLHARFDCVKG